MDVAIELGDVLPTSLQKALDSLSTELAIDTPVRRRRDIFSLSHRRSVRGIVHHLQAHACLVTLFIARRILLASIGTDVISLLAAYLPG
jgi:hypothetical protein